MTTDNRTNELTLEQVEAAFEEGMDAIDWGMVRNGEGDPQEAAGIAVRAALVAAQGAAPQAESVPKSTYISPNLPGMIRNLWKSDPSENSVRTALKLAGDLIQELIDLRAAPVPSSGVDEDAMAEVIGGVLAGQEAMHCNRVWEAWGYGTMSEDDFSLVSDDEEAVTEIARAVSAYLRGES